MIDPQQLVLCILLAALVSCQSPSGNFVAPAGQYCFVLSTIPIVVPVTSSSSAENRILTNPGMITTSVAMPSLARVSSDTKAPVNIPPSTSTPAPVPTTSSTSMANAVVEITSSPSTVEAVTSPATQTAVDAPAAAAGAPSATTTSPVPTSASSTTQSATAPINTQNSASTVLRPSSIFLFLSALIFHVQGYLTTVGNTVYSCASSVIVVSRTLTSKSPAATTTTTSPLTTTTAGTTTGGATKPGNGNTGSDCTFDQDCSQRLGYCRSGTCAIGECAGNADCGSHARCRSHSCEQCIRGALGVYIC